MDISNPYIIVLALSCVIIVSYFFSEIARRTNIPSVLLLVLLGIGIKYALDWASVDMGGLLQRALEILGIVGLIMIVLEAALDLRLSAEKSRTLGSALFVALLSLGVTSFVLAYALQFALGLDPLASLVYAIPLSILSSAIIIPSVASLAEVKREFLVYESAFSDVLGIIFFNLAVTATAGASAASISLDVVSNLGLSTVLAIVISYALVYLFQRISSDIKLFFLIAVLVALYASAEMLNLSALVIILLFGLVLKNEELFFRGRLRQWIKTDALSDIVETFHVVTRESAFVVRTFFFVVFGMTLTISALVDADVGLLSTGIVAVIYVIRFAALKAAGVPSVKPEMFVAPRGLVTILLFFAIPAGLQRAAFDPAIVLFVVIGTSLVMTYGLVMYGKETGYVRALKFGDWDALDAEIEQLQKKRDES